MIGKFLCTIGKCLRQLLKWTLKVLLWIIVIYPPLQVLIHYTADADLPNGAVLERVIDWEKGSRVDLYKSDWGKLLVRDVEWICYNDTEVDGIGFIWLGGEHEVIFADDPRYQATLKASGLFRPRSGCAGYHGAYIDPLLLINKMSRVIPEVNYATPEEWRKRRFENPLEAME
jgi:hypothetical protein